MATEKKKIQTVEQYHDSLPPESQALLQQVQQAIAEAVPEAEEVISYQIPAFKYHGWIFYYSAYTKHYSLACPPPFTVFEAFREELAPYKLSKSAISFPLDKPVPVDLIMRMSKFRAEENLTGKKK